MTWLNSYKTIVGVLITLLSILLRAINKDAGILPALEQQLKDIGDHLAPLLTGIGALLTLVGVVHKKQKAKWIETGKPPAALAPKVEDMPGPRS